MQDFPPPGSGTFDEISLNETLKRAVLSIEINKKQHQPMERASQATMRLNDKRNMHQQQQQMYMQQQQQLQQHHQQQQQQQQRAAESHPSASTGAQLINVVRQSERNVRALMNQMLCVLGSNPPNEFVTVQRLLELMGGAMETFVGATRQYGQSINDVVIGGRATELSNDTTVRFRALAGAVGQNNVAMSQGCASRFCSACTACSMRRLRCATLSATSRSARAFRLYARLPAARERTSSRRTWCCTAGSDTLAWRCSDRRKRRRRRRRHGGARHAHGRNASGTVLIGNAVGSQSGFGPQPVRRPSMNQQPQQQQTPYSHFGHASASSPQLRR
jgi:hypothetical protein